MAHHGENQDQPRIHANERKFFRIASRHEICVKGGGFRFGSMEAQRREIKNVAGT